MHYDLKGKSRSTTKEQTYTTQKADRYEEYSQRKEDKYGNPYSQRKEDKYVNPYSQRKEDKYVNPYSQRKEDKYGDPRHDYKSYHQEKAKQEKSRRVFKYKTERDESGNSRYVLEEPIDNPLKLINNHDIVCIYPSNGAKYYKNINIYNYKKKIII